MSTNAHEANVKDLKPGDPVPVAPDKPDAGSLPVKSDEPSPIAVEAETNSA